MRKLIFAVTIFPIMVQAGNIRDFFKLHPELDNNIAIHSAISKTSHFEAAGFARREGGDEDELMKTKGDQFAVLGFRRVKNACKYPQAAEVLSLTPDDCAIILKTDI